MTPSETNAVLRLRHDQLSWREVDGEVIVLDLANATYFAVNPSAARLWLALSKGATRAQLIDDLVTTYGIDEAQAAADVDAFIESCRTDDLLET